MAIFDSRHFYFNIMQTLKFLMKLIRWSQWKV